ncbi:MAG: hypothetical protein AMS21_13105 [Gemmatimonas sp. SG8_38_2]|nr:MAG: hypothetical protein AMS21_13105 [Gemmatimonas sp. SG8_38_2]
MARELGGSQISALLESVPGIVNVLRSPVADALVGMIHAGAGLEEFRLDYAKELVQYAVRRGLISSAEGDRLLDDVMAAAPKGRRKATPSTKTKKAAGKKVPTKKSSPKGKAAQKKRAAKKPAKQTAKRVKRR